MNISWLKSWIGIGVGAVLLSGCGQETNQPQDAALPILEQIEAGLYLEKAQSCDDLETYLKDMQFEAMKNQLMNGYGYDLPGGATPGMVFAEEDMAASAPTALGGEDGGAAPNSVPSKAPDLDENYTGTNNQEATVDEADIVKTDGAHVYILRDASLLIASAWPPEDAEIVATVGIEGSPRQMFVQDDTLVVFSDIWDVWNLSETLGENLEMENIWQLSKVTLMDITDRANPSIVREVYTDASFQSARLVGQTARVVLAKHTSMNMGYGGGFSDAPVSVATPNVVGVSTGSAGSEREEDVMLIEESAPEPAEEEAEAGKADLMIVIKNDSDNETLTAESAEEAMALLQLQGVKEMIDAQTLEQMVPKAWNVVHNDDGTATTTKGLLAECENHYKPSVAAGLSLLSVLTLDMAAPAESREGATVIGEAGIVYGSANAIYIASNLYTGWLNSLPDADEDFQVTAIHKFDIASSGDEAIYAGTGTISGSVLNQYSISEFEGNLRVAHTRNNWMTGSSDNRVSVLAPADDGSLETIGALEGLAEGEQIYSARFMGEKGYVVTFETVDPLFTIDLSDPTNPTKVGELKIPGFSTYIHPLGNDHLLTIGQNTVENDWGGFWVQGIQLTIFDVSDFANPTQAHKIVLEDSAWSQAVYESKAFTFHPELGLLALPLEGWGFEGGTAIGISEEEAFEWADEEEEAAEPFIEEEENYGHTVGLALYSVNPEDGILDHGFVDHSSFLEDNTYGYEQVRRSLIMGDHVFSIGRLGMKIVDAETVEEVSALPFPSEEEFYNQESFGEFGIEDGEDMAWEEEPMMDTAEPESAEDE